MNVFESKVQKMLDSDIKLRLPKRSLHEQGGNQARVGAVDKAATKEYVHEHRSIIVSMWSMHCEHEASLTDIDRAKTRMVDGKALLSTFGLQQLRRAQ